MSNSVQKPSVVKGYINADEIIKKCVYKELFVRYLGSPVPAEEDGEENGYFPCPFCELTEDSFKVSKVRNYFHCSYCGIGGNSINFVQEMKLLNSQHFKDVVMWLKYLVNDRKDIINRDENKAFGIRSIRFNVALLMDYEFLSDKRKPVKITETDKLFIEDQLFKMEYTKTAVSKLRLERMLETYVIVIAEDFNVKDFIAYNEKNDYCLSVLYKQYTDEQMESFKEEIKSQI